MKIRTFAIGIVVVLASSYAGATYYYSTKAEASASEWMQKTSQAVSYLKASNDYQRGFLRSTQNITLEFPFPGPNAKTSSVTLRSVIHHGPLPGFSGMGIARIDHSLVFDETTAQELAKAFGDAPPLAAVTTVNFDGDGTTVLKGAAGSYKRDGVEITWQGMSGAMRFRKGMLSYSADITAPGVLFAGKDGAGASLDALSLKLDQVRMANTENLYLGTMNARVAAFSLTKNGKSEFDMKNIAMSSDTTSKEPGFVDIVGRFAVDEFRSAAFSGTNAEYAFSARHLHAQSLDRLSEAMQESRRSAVGGAQGQAAMQAGIMQAVSTHGLALLSGDPVIAIERIGFVSKEGETKFSGSARLVGVSDTDMANPMNLVAKLQVDATIKVSEAFVGVFMVEAPLKAMRAQGREPTAEEIAQLTAQMRLAFEQKLADLVDKGLVVREGGFLSARLAFKAGNFTVNDKPFNPMGDAQAPR